MWYKKSNFGGGVVAKGNGNVINSVPQATPSLADQDVLSLKQQVGDLKAKVDNDVYYDIENVYPDINDLQGVKGMTKMLQNPNINPLQMTMEELLEPARQPKNIIDPSGINSTEPDQYMRASIDNNVPSPGANWQRDRIPNPNHPMNTPYQK